MPATFDMRGYQTRMSDLQRRPPPRAEAPQPPAADGCKPIARPSAALLRATSRPTTAEASHRQALSSRARDEHEHKRALDEAMAREERERQAARQLEAARAGHKQAVAHVRKARAKQRAELQKMDAHHAEADERRARAVAALKDSTLAAASDMRAAAERRAARSAKAERQRQVDATAIHERGGNPYLLLRQRDEEARLARERSEADLQAQENRDRLGQQLAKQLAREANLRQAARDERAAARPLAHINAPFAGGPRAIRHPSTVELG